MNPCLSVGLLKVKCGKDCCVLFCEQHHAKARGRARRVCMPHPERAHRASPNTNTHTRTHAHTHTRAMETRKFHGGAGVPGACAAGSPARAVCVLGMPTR